MSKLEYAEVGTGNAMIDLMTSPFFSGDSVRTASHDTAMLPFLTDRNFEEAYPENVRRLSRAHWTPVEVCRTAAQFLVTGANTRVLDIGCGPGKFCAIGAAATAGHFVGVEQREHLVAAARLMLRYYGVSRVEIVHANVSGVNFRQFDAFYLFNPFEENVYPSLRIDFRVELTTGLYASYTGCVQRQLALAPPGTRVATYCGDCDEIPDCYDCLDVCFGGRLKFWIKTRRQPPDPPDREPNTTAQPFGIELTAEPVSGAQSS